MISKIYELRDLVLFTGKGNNVVRKLDKERPDVFMAAKYIELEEDENCVVIDCGDGQMGLALAQMNRSTGVGLYDSNVSMRRLSGRNVDANFELSNVRVVGDSELEEMLSEGKIDSVVYSPKGFSALELVRSRIEMMATSLGEGGKFYLISNNKAGANKLVAILEEAFGQEARVLGKGKGGFRVVVAEKVGDVGQGFSLESLRRKVDYEFWGRRFNVVTEPSLFSKDGLDKGTRYLLESVELDKFRRMLDVGCGWGAIGLAAAVINTDGEVVTVDVDTRAVALAEENANRMGVNDRVECVATDEIKTINGNFDLVLSNPPFHADRGTLIDIFNGVRAKLAKKGRGFVVVERTYKEKLESVLEEVFGSVRVYDANEEIGFYVMCFVS